ncbi:MAG: UvrD-helicase domain-containing protein [Eubacterium sp.]|nr:UvrD-helicase domain-containing protein [Eubacterium sp.]
MSGLNPKQEEARSYTEGPLLILAGAGSGKTRVITHRIAYLIEEKGVSPYHLLAITFTNKAAQEMRERVEQMIDEGQGEIWVSTFHSMCVRILRRFHDRLGGKNNFTIYDTDDQKAVVKEALKVLNLDEKQYPVKGMISAISKAKEEFLSPEELARKNEWNFHDRNVAEVYREYQKRLRSSNSLDFDDLINRTIELFMQHPDVLELYQERFRYIMVDEYQDTNHAQFVLVKMLAEKYRNLCVVGDDDQSIYKFRGANIYNILNFEEEYPDAKVIKLEQNYRSTANILNAANGVIAHNEGRKDKKLWTEREDGEKLRFTCYESDREEAAGLIRTVIDGKHDYSDYAVLYRTNAQSRVIEEGLIRAGIPYQLVGGTNFYARKEIRDMVGYLKAINNPADAQSLSRIINVPRRGIGDTTIAKLREFADAQEMSLYDAIVDVKEIPGLSRAAAKVEAFGELFEEFRRTAETGDLSALYREILEKTGYKLELERENTEEARGRIENLEELGNKITDFEIQHDGATLQDLLEDIALVADTDQEEDEAGRITLMTLHSAKGLEFPIVFMVGMEERLFPSGLSLDSDDPDATEEERRLCYVGITRAEDRLYLSAAKQRMVNGQYIYPAVSRFIDEIPKNLIERDDESFDSFERSVTSAWRPEEMSFHKKTGYIGGESARYFSQKKTDTGSRYSVKPAENRTSGGGFVPDYRVGDRVRHMKFGQGTVTEMEKGGKDYEVTVLFDTVGEKRMFASLAKLRKM